MIAMSVISWWQTRDLLPTDGDAQIPTLSLPLLGGNGKVATLAPDAARNTLIYFFAPWCSICRMSIGNLNAVDNETTRIVVIALDYETIGEVQQFVDDVGVTVPVLLGDPRIGQLFQIKGYPTYYILDSDFRVVSRDMGYSSRAGIRLRSWRARTST